MLLLIKKNPVNSLIALSKLGQIATVIRIEDTEIFFFTPFSKNIFSLKIQFRYTFQAINLTSFLNFKMSLIF